MEFQYSKDVKDAVENALEKEGYMVAISYIDNSDPDNNMKHMFIRENFPTSDIIPSIDTMIRSLDIEHSPENIDTLVDLPIPPDVPLRIAIMTHMNRMPESYSPANAVKRQLEMLKNRGHDVTLMVQENSEIPGELLEYNVQRIIPSFNRVKNVVNEEVKRRFIDIIKERVLGQFDVVITHDFFIDDCITYREAIKEYGLNVVPFIKWIHWARSAIGNPIDFYMQNAKYVYMNYADKAVFAQKIGVDEKDVYVVFNEKDPVNLFGFSDFTKMLVNKFRLWEKDIIQVFPICSTRMDAKGIDSVIKTMAAIKRHGKNVSLIVCNSNASKKKEDIRKKIEFAESLGLSDGDLIFTSEFASKEFPVHEEVKNKDVTDLMRLANLFVFPTVSEVCSNALLEALMSKNLVVLNEDLPSLFDFVDNDCVMKFPFSSIMNMHYSNRDEDDFNYLARDIIERIYLNSVDTQFRRAWRVHNEESIYKMLACVLY